MAKWLKSLQLWCRASMLAVGAARFSAVCLIASLLHSAVNAANAPDAPWVRVNQIGYLPSDPKLAIVLSRGEIPEKFQVIDVTSGRVALEKASFVVEGAWGEFAHHAVLDFSSLAADGLYTIRIGDAESPAFGVRKAVYANLPDEMLDFMRQQRCGYNPWVGVDCHRLDGRTVDGPLPAGTFVDAYGGWHDAGDQLKYLLTASNATGQLLLAYQLGDRREFANKFNDLGQPQSNGIPDVLDEARWGLDWMLRLHPAPDQLYHQVADDRDHKGWRLPQEDNVDYGWGAGSYRVVYSADGKPQGIKQFKSASDGVANLAGRYAAGMALAYQVWKDDQTLGPYAAKCLQASKEVYELGRAKEGVQQGNSYGAPYRYEETTWADDMEWGAAELLRATGEDRYRADAIRYARLAATDSWMGKTTPKHYQYYPFMNVGHFRLYDQVDDEAKSTLAGYYRTEIEACVAMSAGNPYRVGVPFVWCSNNFVVALATECRLFERMTGDNRYHEFAALQRDWLLGRNPWGTSMFTEIPADGVYPHDVHLFPNILLKRSVRGGLVDGPVARKVFQSLKGVTIREPDPLAPFQDEQAVYHDDAQDYSTNEPTMDGTASAILLFALWADRT